MRNNSNLKLKTQTRFDVITIGGATRDIFFETSKGRIISNSQDPLEEKLLAFEYGAKIIPEEVYFSYGGGGANVASSFGCLGLKVAACLNLGKEGTGDLVLKNLKKAKVNTSLVRRDSRLHTGLSFILSCPSGERVIFSFHGANTNLTLDEKKLAKTKWLYLTSLRGKANKLLTKIAHLAAKNNLSWAFNPGEEQLKRGYWGLREFLRQISVLILNKDEAIELVLSHHKKIKISQIENLLKTIKKWGPKIVTITDGEGGAWAYDGQKIHYQEAFKIKTKDMTGAGDAFGSTFVGMIILGYNIEEALKLAAKNAGSVVSHFGAQEGLLSLEKLLR